MAAAASGSGEQLGEWLETFRAYLLYVANHELKPELRQKVGASDLVQKTLMEALQGLHNFRGYSVVEFQHWLGQMLNHNIVDVARRYSEAEMRDVSREVSFDVDSRRPADPADAAQTPRSAAIEREETAALKRAVSRLPADYREAIVLRSWQRLPFAEVGRRMNRSDEAARKLWTRAIDQLRIELDADCEG